MNRFLRFSVAVIFSLLSLSSVEAIAQDRAQMEKEIASLVEQLKAKEAEFLSPSAEDRAAFADFLKQPDTGLIRLLPREQYREKLIIREGGAYYSFTRLTHEYGSGSDLSLERGQLSVGFAGANFGYLADIGDFPIEEITLDHPGVQFLAAFVTPSTEPEARAQQRLSGSGFTTGGFTYRRAVPVETNKIYVLRSVNYSQSDVLVAFRTVRQDTDGSLIILWKMLNKYPKPELDRP